MKNKQQIDNIQDLLQQISSFYSEIEKRQEMVELKVNQLIETVNRKTGSDIPKIGKIPTLDEAAQLCNLGVRAYTICCALGAEDSIEVLTEITKNEILKHRNCGRKSVFEIEKMLNRFGLSFAKRLIP